MTDELRFGVLVLQDFPYQELTKLWLQFEQLGFDSTWVADHFVNYANPTSPWLEGWTVTRNLHKPRHTSPEMLFGSCFIEAAFCRSRRICENVLRPLHEHLASPAN